MKWIKINVEASHPLLVFPNRVGLIYEYIHWKTNVA